MLIGDVPPAGGVAEALGMAEDDEQHILVVDDEGSEDEARQPPTPPGELPSEDEVEAEQTTLLDRLGLNWNICLFFRSDSTRRTIPKAIGILIRNRTCSISNRKREHPLENTRTRNFQS